MIEDNALLNEYLSEAEELMDALLADLDALDPSTEAGSDIHLINRIFRTVHSLKGLSGMMGLGEIQTLAHQFEDILDELRLGNLPLDQKTAEAFREAGIGVVAVLSGSARNSVRQPDYDRVRSLLESLADRPRKKVKQDAEGVESLGLSEDERKQLRKDEERRIAANVSAGRAFYSVTVQFHVGQFAAKYRAVREGLEQSGELITTFSQKTDDVQLIGFKLLYASQLKEVEVKRLVEPFDGQVARLGRSSWKRAGDALKAVGKRQKKGHEDAATSQPPANRALLPPTFAQEMLQPFSPSVRVDLSQIDELSGLAHQLAIETERLSSLADRYLLAAGFGARERFDLRLSARRLEREFLELEERLVELRMVSLAQTFNRATRLAERLAQELGKSIRIEATGRETQLDKMIVDRIADPIYHILRNALDHGVESPEERRRLGKPEKGNLRIEAQLEGARAVIAVCDDGSGINSEGVLRRAVEIGAIPPDAHLTEEEILKLIFHPGFSTADRVSEVSGRGVGLDAVARTVHELGGELRVSSEPGKGTRMEMAVPTTLVMISAFIVRVSEWRYAVNVGQITELMYVGRDQIIGRDGRRSVEYRGTAIPLVELKYLLGLGGARVFPRNRWVMAAGSDRASDSLRSGEYAAAKDRLPVLIAPASGRYVAMAVEEFEEQREIIVKSLGSLSPKFRGVVGAVDLEGGDVALVLDIPTLLLSRSVRF